MGGIDAKCIGGLLWKLTRVSMKFCYTCVKKYPSVAGVLLVLFLLFMFLPSVFFFLIYSSPILALVTVSIQIYFKINRFKAQNAKKNEEIKPSSVVESKPVAVSTRKYEKPIIHKQLSRRRNFKQNIELDRTLNDGSIDDSQSVQAQVDLVTSSAARNVGDVHDDLMGKTGLSDGQESKVAQNVQAVCDDLKGKTSLNEENHSLEQGESSLRNIQAVVDQPSSDLLSHDGGGGGGGGEAEVESSDGEDDDEEEVQRGGNKAVEWTEDDQRNLMDLGDSELERNKRLESLIAKRRARKLFKLAIEKRLMDSGSASAMPIPPIFTLKNNLLAVMPNSLDESLPMPGSAPSVLLPGRNPFDLPYDPLEEKPNLMADSFQQEFMAAQQKDLLFCRHESFCLGPSLLSESQQDQHKNSRFSPYVNEKKHEEGHRFSRFRSQSYMSSHDQLIDELLFQEDEALSRNMSATDLIELEGKASKTNSVESEDKENQETGKGKTIIEGESTENHDMETDSAKDNSTDRCSMASSEASELSFSSNIPTNIEILEAKGGKYPQRFGDRVQSALTFSVPNSTSFDGSSYDSSPSGTDKPPRLDNRLFYRERTGPCHSPGYSIASDLQVEVSEVGSPPFTIDGTASPADAESLYDGDIDKDINSGSEELWGTPCHLAGVEETIFSSREVNEVSEEDIVELGFSAIKQDLEDAPGPSFNLPEEVAANNLPPENEQAHCENLDMNVSENVLQVAEEVQKSCESSDALSSENPEEAILSLRDSTADPPHEVQSDQKPEEPLEFPEKSVEEVNVIDNVGDQVVHANDDEAKLESIGEIDGSAQILINQEATEDPSQSVEESTSESNNYTDNNIDKPAENQSRAELEKKIEDILNPETIEEDPGNVNEQDDIGGTSKTIEGIDNQSITEVGVDLRFDDPSTSALQPELEAEQVATNSSSSSSPSSVLPGNIPIDQIPSSSYDQLVHHIDVPRSIVDDIFSNNSLDEESPEGLTRTTPPNLQQLLTDPTDQPTSTSTDSGKSEEPSVKVITHPGSVDDIKGKSPILPELEPGISQEKTAEIIANLKSDFPETTAKEEEASNSEEMFTREANVDNVTNPVVDEKDDEDKLESVEGNQDQSEIDIETSEVNEGVGEVTTSESIEDENNEKLTENEATVGPSRTIDENESLSIITGSEKIVNLPKSAISEDSLEVIEDSPDELATAETAARKEKLNSADENNEKEELEKLKSGQDNEGEYNVTNNNDDQVVKEKEDEEKSNSVKGSEDESHISMTDATEEQLEAAEATTTSKSIEDGEEDKGELAGHEAIAVPLTSDDGNESSNVIKGSEDVKDLPILVNSESSLEAVEDSQGEPEESENEPAIKPSIPASGTAEEKESSNPLQQKPEEEVDIIHKVNETAAYETSNSQNLIQQENVEVIKSEQHDPGEDNVNKTESTSHSTIEESKPVESKVKASEQETNTAV